MRGLILALVIFGWWPAAAAEQVGNGKIVKVLPEFLDAKGLNTRSPSLYDRDAYQAVLRRHPEKRAGLRFYVLWRTKAPIWEPLVIRLEMRGLVKGDLPPQRTLEQPVPTRSGFNHWTELELFGDAYKQFGEVTAWRVTLWEGERLLSEQKSFLW